MGRIQKNYSKTSEDLKSFHVSNKSIWAEISSDVYEEFFKLKLLTEK